MPENSIAALIQVSEIFDDGFFEYFEQNCLLFQCLEKNCRNILLDLEVTKCNQLVILNKQTLEKAGIHEPINQLLLESLKDINTVEHHALA